MPTTADNSTLQGLYINLARSTERRALCEEQLSQANLGERYRRLEAVDGAQIQGQRPGTTLSPAKTGCWLSHIAALEQARDYPGHTHILEDDFQLTEAFPGFIDNLAEHTRAIGDWDIIFTDVDLAGMFDVNAMKKLIATVNSLTAKNSIELRDALPLYAAANSSYIVNGDNRQKVYDLMKEGLTSNLPNDLWLRKLSRDGKIKAYVTLPFVTTVNAVFNDSTILGNIGNTNPSILFATLFRRSLAAGADTGALLTAFKQHLGAMQPINNRSMIYAHLVAHFMSDDFKSY
jgi:GR25 family glycosyltransferase involved in LPS biosynthesis